MDMQTLVNTLADQRNLALNQVAELTATIATLKEQISNGQKETGAGQPKSKK